MALTYDNITSITRKWYIPKMVDNIVDSDPVLMRLLGEAVKGSGTSIMVPVKYAKNTSGGSYAGLDTLTTSSVETRTAAEFAWKQYYQSLVLSGINRAKNKGDQKVLDLVKLATEEAELDLKDKMMTDLYGDGTTNSSKVITGLRAVADDGSNVGTYGAIVRGTNSWWNAYYAATVGSLTLDNLATGYTGCAAGSDVPSLMVTTETVWNAYEALLQPSQRFNLMMDGYPQMDREGISKSKQLGADAGFRVVFFRGTPIVASDYCTAGDLFFLNEKYLDFKVLPNAKYPSDKFGFAMTDMKEPINQDGEVAQVLWYGNLVCSQCRRQGQMRGVTA